MSLDDLYEPGPPIRLRDLRTITGFSKMKFLADIERGQLKAKPVITHRTSMWLVERDEARRYLAAIGFAA